MASEFKDRADAGRRLALSLRNYRDRSDLVVVGLSRSGVAVAYEVAKALEAPLDVIAVRKLRVPDQPALILGAIAPKEIRVLDERLVSQLGLTDEVLDQITEQERRLLRMQEMNYRRHGPLLITGKTVLLVDDGIATGMAMHTAIIALHAQHPAHVVIAVPVAAPEISREFKGLIALMTPIDFYSVGYWYDDFSQISEEEVINLLDNSVENQRSLERDSRYKTPIT